MLKDSFEKLYNTQKKFADRKLIYQFSQDIGIIKSLFV